MAMPNSRKIRILWERNPRCHWCGRKTHTRRVPLGRPTQFDRATLDHYYPLRIRKDMTPSANWQDDVVLACYECNHKKAGKHPEVFASRRPPEDETR